MTENSNADGNGNPDPAPDRVPDGNGDILDGLFAVVQDRKEHLPEGSYTASLFTHEKGQNAVLEKLGEEMTELVLAAKDENEEAIVHESADLVYHLLVLLAIHGLDLDDLRAQLRERR
jgi:phosphoribosyl-ATP pyrophosphohydrolase